MCETAQLRADADHLLSLVHDQTKDFADLLDVVGRINERVDRLDGMMAKTGSPTSLQGHENKGDGMTANGLRKERVTLEIVTDNKFHILNTAECVVFAVGERLRKDRGESVRVVDGDITDDEIRLTVERDAAIRRADRDSVKCSALADKVISLMARVAELESEQIGLRGDVKAAEIDNKSLREQLESVADRAAAAEMALQERTSTATEVPRDAPAASGESRKSVGSDLAGRLRRFNDRLRSGEIEMPQGPPKALRAASDGGEPVAWMCEWTDHTELYGSRTQAERAAAGDVVPQPLYRAIPQPRGWLTEEERDFLDRHQHECAERASTLSNAQAVPWVRRVKLIDALLARSSPPEVVLRSEPHSIIYADNKNTNRVFKAKDVIRALAAAGVAVKETT
jgi:outer membrane murein-binding lipoprotein Lpp